MTIVAKIWEIHRAAAKRASFRMDKILMLELEQKGQGDHFQKGLGLWLPNYLYAFKPWDELCDGRRGREGNVWWAVPCKDRLWQRLQQGSKLSQSGSFESTILLHGLPSDHCRSMIPPLLLGHLVKKLQTMTKHPHEIPVKGCARMSRMCDWALLSPTLTVWDTTDLCLAVQKQQQQNWGTNLGMRTSGFITSGTLI